MFYSHIHINSWILIPLLRESAVIKRLVRTPGTSSLPFHFAPRRIQFHGTLSVPPSIPQSFPFAHCYPQPPLTFPPAQGRSYFPSPRHLLGGLRFEKMRRSACRLIAIKVRGVRHRRFGHSRCRLCRPWHLGRLQAILKRTFLRD